MQKVLILRLSALGNVAMTVPVIYSVAEQHPDVQFTVVTRPFFRRIFINHPANVEIIDYDPKATYRGIKGLMSFIRHLKEEGFTAVADLHDVIRTRAIRMALRLKSIPVAKVDKNRRAHKRLIHDKGRTYQPNYVDRYADVFRRLGYPVEVDFKSVYPEPEKREGIGVAPFARYATKTYSPKMMEETLRLLTDAGVSVTLFGGRGKELAQIEEWIERNPALKSMAGKMPMEDELKEMGKLKLMVTMDSANMHLASLVGTPVISVWGSTIPQCGFLGYGQSADNAVWLDLECQPCSVAGLPECPIGHYACLERISPQTLAYKVLEKLEDES